jgi:hypothetical protein
VIPRASSGVIWREINARGGALWRIRHSGRISSSLQSVSCIHVTQPRARGVHARAAPALARGSRARACVCPCTPTRAHTPPAAAAAAAAAVTSMRLTQLFDPEKGFFSHTERAACLSVAPEVRSASRERRGSPAQLLLSATQQRSRRAAAQPNISAALTRHAPTALHLPRSSS